MTDSVEEPRSEQYLEGGGVGEEEEGDSDDKVPENRNFPHSNLIAANSPHEHHHERHAFIPEYQRPSKLAHVLVQSQDFRQN